MPAKRNRDGEDEGKSPIVQPAVPHVAPKAVHKAYYPPQGKDIDLNKYDLPQPKCQLEWWYYNCHLTSKKTGEKFSLFSSFFRQMYTEKKTETGKVEFVDACTWALIDIKNENYYADSLLDHRATEVLVKRLDPKFTGKKTQHAEGPLLALAKQGKLPRPDRSMKKAAVVAADKFNVNYDNECTATSRAPKASEKQAAMAPKTVYDVKTYNPFRKCGSDLSFVPQTKVQIHGENGIVNDMFYYYIPKCSVTGKITVEGVEHEVEGSGWYDREFGGSEDSTGRDALDAWTWFSIQLADDYQFSLFNVVDRETHAEKEKIAVLTDPQGNRKVITNFQLTYQNNWTSMNTYIEYPTEWKLVVPTCNLELHITAAFRHQEFSTILVTGAGFYEGRMQATGTHNNKPVTGTGFLERKNFMQYENTAGMLKNVGKYVRKTLQEMYPLDTDIEWINKYCFGRQCTFKGVDPKIVCDTIFKPIRALTDRGGKAWRSLILVSSMNAVSEKYIDCTRYIAISELLHVGSLVIDDIQDESTIRRGGRCVHLDYGNATAINAGTACYFMAPILSGINELPDDKQLKIYQLYFDVLRSGHAGQGLDIHGLDYLMPDVVATGKTQNILDSLRAIHTYKTGGAAGTLCRMACVIAGASEEQSDALENYGTQIGLAFQIVDDALNLRGFEGDLKEVGEDIRDGKVTYPIIAAMAKLDLADRTYIYSILQEKTSDTGKIASVIQMLNSVGAIDACLKEAREFVEVAWDRLDRVVVDSLPKIMMRAFADYLTERTF